MCVRINYVKAEEEKETFLINAKQINRDPGERKRPVLEELTKAKETRSQGGTGPWTSPSSEVGQGLRLSIFTLR